MKSFFSFMALATCLSCGSEEGVLQTEPVAERDSIQLDSSAIMAQVEQNPFEDSLQAYFKNPVDFYTLKTKTMHMHSGSSPDFAEASFHQTANPDSKLYGYWAVEFDLKNPAERSLLFATQKPWKTKEQRSYENDNEIVVGIQSQLAWEVLGPTDFVKKTRTEIENRFGTPHAEKENCLTYFLDEYLLLLHLKDEKVDWFKYFWLAEPVEKVDSIPASFFFWRNNH